VQQEHRRAVPAVAHPQGDLADADLLEVEALEEAHALT
jgi:hypothetical protein